RHSPLISLTATATTKIFPLSLHDALPISLEQLDLNYFIPCRIREHTVAILGLGKTVDGDFLSSDDVELVETIAGYVAGDGFDQLDRKSTRLNSSTFRSRMPSSA